MPTLSFIKIEGGYPVIDIGKMRHQVTIQHLSDQASPPSYNSAGIVQTWQTLYSGVMAAVEPISGKDIIKGGQTTAQLLLTIAIWYQPGILPNMRVLMDNGSIYVIQSIENVLEMNVVLTLNCLGLSQNT